MKRINNKIISVILSFVCIICLLQHITVDAHELHGNDFRKLLEEYGITVSGEPMEMSPAEMEGLLADAKCKSVSVLEENIMVNPEYILELHYHSLSDEEQIEFLNKIKNQKVDISGSENMILISYNVNEVNEKASQTIRSTKEATIKMQDSVLGGWGSATVTLTGKFTKTTSGKKWSVTLKNESDCSVKEESFSPVQIVNNTTVYWGYGHVYTSSDKYVGNEINIHSFTQVCCGFNSSSLYIYVYPNSSYNYAKIGD